MKIVFTSAPDSAVSVGVSWLIDVFFILEYRVRHVKMECGQSPRL